MTADMQGVMGFAKPKDVVKDTERKGRLRAMTESQDYSEVAETVDLHTCGMHDLNTGKYNIDFFKSGFDCVDMSDNNTLQSHLAKVKAQGVFADDDISAVRKAIVGSVLRLSNGKRLRMLYVAGEGMLIRSSGPNGLPIAHDEAVPTHSKQAAASMVHGDQDVYGYPLKRIMKGAAPWVFRHQSPDGSNRLSPVNLVNIWIPLQQINMPLCLMDRRSLDNQKHQLRFEINVGDTLERDSAHARNDIWTFLHDTKQQWYFNSEMNSDSAYVFDTLGMAHGAAVLPGEEQAEQYFLRICDCLQALRAGDKAAFTVAASKEKLALPEKMTQALSQAIVNMEKVLKQAATESNAIIADGKAWMAQAEAAKNAVIRKSIELRGVGISY